MTCTEDLFGWLFALEQWRPGQAEFSLFLLLDRIQVGKSGEDGDYTEQRAATLLAGLDEQGFRNLVHIPSEGELLASGMPEKEAEVINRSMRFKLEGWVRIANSRAEQGRGWVRAFNKVKHHMMAFPTRERDKEEVWLPSRVRLDKLRNRIDLVRAWLEVSADEVRRWAGDAIAAQLVLHDTLALILVTRYGEKYDMPQWVRSAFQIDYLWRR